VGFEHPSLPVWRCAAQHFVYRLYIQPLMGYLELSGLSFSGFLDFLVMDTWVGYGYLALDYMDF